MSRAIARRPCRPLSLSGGGAARALAFLVLGAVLAFTPLPDATAKPAPDGFADLAARLLPAVVNVSSTQTIKPGQEGGDPGSDPDQPNFPPGSPFEQFFHDFLNRNHGGPGQNEAVPRHATSLGSGFVID